jgi:hypothetical protein
MPDAASPRVLIFYAYESPDHTADVERLYKLLRANGVDAQLDLVAAKEPREWVLWMIGEIRKADHVLMIISPSYKQGFESDLPAWYGVGVGWEARIIRDEIYRDQAAARRKFLTVLLPGGRREDIPDDLPPWASSPYYVDDFTLVGAETLIRRLTKRPVAPTVEAEAALSLVLQLVVTAQDSHVSEQIVNAMTKAVAERAASVQPFERAESVQPIRLSDGRLAGAFIMIAAKPTAELIEASIRTVHEHVRAAVGSTPSLATRIGLDMESSRLSSVGQVTGRLVQSQTARAMHAVRGANLVVAATPAFRRWAIDAKVGFPAASSYREVADESVPSNFWIAVPGRSVCPRPPQLPGRDLQPWASSPYYVDDFTLVAAETLIRLPPAALKVFLCHGSEDKVAVRNLYKKLLADNLNPWFDEIDILPGADWDATIRDAVRSCDMVLVCLSNTSIGKTGYLQKEIRFALDRADEKPEGEPYIIPVRLEECKVPVRLSRWQRVDLFEPNGYERLMSALRQYARQGIP